MAVNFTDPNGFVTFVLPPALPVAPPVATPFEFTLPQFAVAELLGFVPVVVPEMAATPVPHVGSVPPVEPVPPVPVVFVVSVPPVEPPADVPPVPVVFVVSVPPVEPPADVPPVPVIFVVPVPPVEPPPDPVLLFVLLFALLLFGGPDTVTGPNCAVVSGLPEPSLTLTVTL